LSCLDQRGATITASGNTNGARNRAGVDPPNQTGHAATTRNIWPAQDCELDEEAFVVPGQCQGSPDPEQMHRCVYYQAELLIGYQTNEAADDTSGLQRRLTAVRRHGIEGAV
jgi:hypothetical protein